MLVTTTYAVGSLVGAVVRVKFVFFVQVGDAYRPLTVSSPYSYPI